MPVSKERTAWLVRDAEMIPGPEASDELLAAIGRLPPGNRPAIDAIAVGWGLPVTAAAKLGECSLCNLIATCYVLGQE